VIPPPNPASGPAASVAALERLRQFAISSNVTSGGGLRKAFGGGSVFSIPETKRQRPSFVSSVAYPFDLTLEDAGATFTGKFRPGTVNGLIPSNYLSLTGIAKTGTVYIGIVCTFSNAAIQTAVFAAGGTAPPAYLVTKNVPPTDLRILTHVVVQGVVYRVIGPNSLTVKPDVWFETDKTGTLVTGERPVDYWYSYSVTS
jgi:hypothetical protein